MRRYQERPSGLLKALSLTGLALGLTIVGLPSGPSVAGVGNGMPDAIVYGAQPGGILGADLAVGDLNGDGIADLVVNAPWSACPTNRTAAGAVYVVFGDAHWPAVTDLLDEADVTICGADANDALGSGVRHEAGALAIGDVNGDGHNDLLIGAAEVDGPADSRANAGAAYVLFGSQVWQSSIDLAEPYHGVVLYGVETGDFFGSSVAVGDLDGDGYGDMVIGSMNADVPGIRRQAGKVYVWYGREAFDSVIDARTDIADLIVLGGSRSEGLGTRVRTGDLNADGLDDLLLGAPFADYRDRRRNGLVYALLSPASRRTGVFDLSTQLPDWLVFGESDGDLIGQHLAIGDLNGDGMNDVLIGAPDMPVTVDRQSAGKVFAFFGSDTTSRERSLQDADVVIYGAAEEDFLGDVAAGDVTGDGIAEMVLGARQADPAGGPGENRGAVYILSAGAISSPYDLAVGTVHVVVSGVDAGDLLSRVAVGNLDGQGGEDVVAGALWGDGPAGDPREDSGEVLLLLGAMATPTLTVTPTGTVTATPVARATPTPTATLEATPVPETYLPLVARNSVKPGEGTSQEGCSSELQE